MTIEIPCAELPLETLTALVEEVVTREGTDYGPGEYLLEDKVKQVLELLTKGEAVIRFDKQSETCSIVPSDPSKLMR